MYFVAQGKVRVTRWDETTESGIELAIFDFGDVFGEDALYFSMVTFTTVGYGDVILDERWRLLAAFEAANGIIIFGLTTAVVVAVVQSVYFANTSG